MLTDNFVTMEIGKAKHIALVAHDGKKKELIEWCDRNKEVLQGHFLCGTGTTARLIAEKTGPHFAVGDTCYSWSEDIKVYNPNGKEIVARDNSVSILRKEDIEKAYYQCHTDITIPYEELEEISVLTKDGKNIILLKDGRFVLPGTEVLNKPLDEYDGQ